ncbi:MAG: rod shape-determining protein RodA [Proteiniphilum sp.]|jgi:rod shape determining protein RodA|nr:rod shape-determining protein RodA [Proteiniphilum sp.]NCB24827.1 rod shape-determining protein RodA [Bacteroidia bacterium]MDD2937192.1 rod shape-determining protein RodA [Proteiniphilum sp.]MDD3076586.1 rod shape-determining protein RodA [Proteiniphilum sp.]MDD3956217.1 rod shape-determining protein RodA [Proteiniphilum sp.]
MVYQGSKEIVEKGNTDWVTVGFYLLFVLLGWLNIYAASFDLEHATSLFDLSGRAGMQLVWIGTSLLLAFSLLKIEVGFYETYSIAFYLAGIALLLLTLLVAQEINGSRSWLIIGPVRLQPAEFMKFTIALALARVCNGYNFRLMERKNLLIVSIIILLPVLLVIAQSETGTALVYLAFLLVLYREGLPGGVLFMGIAAVVYFVLGIKFSDVQIGFFSKGELITLLLIIIFAAAMVWNYLKRQRVVFTILLMSASVFLVSYLLSFFSVSVDWGVTALIAVSLVALYLLVLFFRYRKKSYLFILFFVMGSFVFIESVEYVFYDVLQPHQQMRIKVTLGMEQDLSGAGYHVGQSKIAIGSGGLTGKGFLNGTQTKLKYVPEQDTDFIFCTIGEEHGFIGSAIIMILFMAFILRLVSLAERQTTIFGRVYGYGVVSVFIFHLIVNIGMVIGIMPVIGIPLPFFSYGGSSLWGFTILLFIFLRIDKSRKRN